MSDLQIRDEAIKAALSQNWKEAIRINTQLLLTLNDDIETLNRLGFAYLMARQLTKAKTTFEKVIKCDPYNGIARKNLKKIANMKKNGLTADGSAATISPLLFLEEPGKTKVVECINVAPAHILSSLVFGQDILLKPKKHSVEIRSQNNQYIGALPDDIAYRLLKLIASGNTYQAFIKGMSKNCVTVFLREVKRSRKFQNQPSFSSSTNYIPYVHEAEPDKQEDKEQPDGEGEKDESD